MELIPISDLLSVEMSPDSWRIVQDQAEGRRLAAQITVDSSEIVLADGASIATAQVTEVVLGWVPDQDAWQLGVFVRESDSLSWYEFAKWHDRSAARRAGSALSRLINRPFRFVGGDVAQSNEISQDTQPSLGTAPLKPVITRDLRPLPISMGDWILRPSAEGMVWQLTGMWQFRHVLRVVFFIVASAIFVLLGVGSLNSGLADVSPEFLPWVAFVVALILLYSAGENLWILIMRRQIVVDEGHHEIRCERALTHLVSWRVPYDEVDYLLVSQEAANPQGRRSRKDPMRIAQDAWVHVFTQDETFRLLAEVSEVEGESWEWEAVRRRDASSERLKLDLAEYDTPLHHAVMQTAKRLSVPAYVDIR